MEDFSRFESLIPAGFPVVLVDRTFDTKRFPSVSVSNFQPIYRSVCRLAGKGDKRIGMIGGLPRCPRPRSGSLPIRRRWRTAACLRMTC